MGADRPSGRQLVAIKNQIAGNFDESNWLELAALTETLDLVQSHPRLLRSLSWRDPDYEGHVIDVVKRIIDADPGNYAILTDYLGRACPNGGEFISSSDEGGRRIVFAPSVFKVPSENPDPHLISVMMPFEASMRPVYETVRAAAKDSGFECVRADDIWQNATIIQDVFSLIFRSFIVVCDFTGKNPNVFYEAGVAHTLGKHVVPITQNADHVPFDLQHHRYALYLHNVEGRESLRLGLARRFDALGKQR